MTEIEEPIYTGVVYVRAIGNVHAEIYRLDPPAQLTNEMSEWCGRLRDVLGWARRFNVDTGTDEQLTPGDTIELELDDGSSAEAIITAMFAVDPDRISSHPNTAVDIAGFGSPPVTVQSGKGGPPPAGVREPRRPSPPHHGAAAS